MYIYIHTYIHTYIHIYIYTPDKVYSWPLRLRNHKTLARRKPGSSSRVATGMADGMGLNLPRHGDRKQKCQKYLLWSTAALSHWPTTPTLKSHRGCRNPKAQVRYRVSIGLAKTGAGLSVWSLGCRIASDQYILLATPETPRHPHTRDEIRLDKSHPF